VQAVPDFLKRSRKMEFLTGRVPSAADGSVDAVIEYLHQQKREINYILESIALAISKTGTTAKTDINTDDSTHPDASVDNTAELEEIRNSISNIRTTLNESRLYSETEDGWRVVLHADGCAECWIKYRCEGVKCDIPWGSVYESLPYGGIDYPIVFTETPCQSLSISSTENGAYMLQYPYKYGTDDYCQTKENTGTWCFIHPRAQSAEDAGVCVDIIVKGRWKE